MNKRETPISYKEKSVRAETLNEWLYITLTLPTAFYNYNNGDESVLKYMYEIQIINPYIFHKKSRQSYSLRSL